jgi:serine/threonine-protein kinase
MTPARVASPILRVALDVSPADELNAGGYSSSFLPTPGGSRTALAWTPDGQALVFVGRHAGVQRLYVRRLDAPEARPLPGTEGAQVPAVSPDGRWVAFWTNRSIRKVSIDGSPPMDVASGVAFAPWGLAWDVSGRLFFGGQAAPISEVSRNGSVQPVTTLGDAELSHGLPSLLPGGRVLLYTARRRSSSWGDEEVVAQVLATGERKTLLRDAADARYVSTGHLVFLRRGVLSAVAFDADRLQSGTPVAVLDAVAQALVGGNSGDITGAGQFAISQTGTLAWLAGAVPAFPEARLVAVSRRGEVSPLSAPPRSYGSVVRISPDGRRLAVAIASLTENDLWSVDLGRGVLTRVTAGGEAEWPLWWPDGQHLAFSWLMRGMKGFVRQQTDRSEPPEVLATVKADIVSVSPDGTQLAAEQDGDVMILTLGRGEPSPIPFLQTPDREAFPEFSPDGRWLAYASTVTGRFEVYVQAYPRPGPVYRVSVDGGHNLAWHPNGRGLFFISLRDRDRRRRMMSVAFEAGAPQRLGSPRALFAFDDSALKFVCEPARCYDVSPDGQRFYLAQPLAPPPPPVVTHVNLIQNWVEELKAKVPSGTR